MKRDANDAAAPAVTVEIRSSIAIIRLNRPAERNRLSQTTLAELDSAFSAANDRADLSALIFTGTGDVFTSGADLRELEILTPAKAHEFAMRGQRLFQRIADAKRLTIAAINGYCMGGGLDLALACDLRCAAPEAEFAHPGARLGIITGWGGTQRLPRLVGRARALEMFVTARRLSSNEAYSIGLVNAIGSPVLDSAISLAHPGGAALKAN